MTDTASGVRYFSRKVQSTSHVVVKASAIVLYEQREEVQQFMTTSVASYRGSAMSADTIHYRKPSSRELTAYVTGDNIRKWTGRSVSSLLRIADDISRWSAINTEAIVGIPQSLAEKFMYLYMRY